MNVEKIMTHPAITCRSSDDLATVAGLMWNHDCGAVVVVDNDGGHLAGIVTDRDICMAAYTQGKSLDAISVTTAMASQVVTCKSHDTLSTAEQLMKKQQIRRVVVVDGAGLPLGVLSLNDLARDAVTRKKSGVEHDVLQTLAAIGEPRPLMRPSAAPSGPTAKLQATA